ncbi:MAG TPA: hypothetical protein VIJ09_06740 [Acidimicrobiales bacterium]|jgi:hypothetical protein
MVEIGEGTGALVVYTPATLEGQEIEIRPHHGVWAGAHTGVRARHVGQKVLHAGVFGSLPVGLYDLRLRRPSTEDPTRAVTTVAVTSGGVAETKLSPTDDHP